MNLARRPGFVAPPKGVPTDRAAAPRGEAYRGLRWGQISARWYGASSVYDVQPSLVLPSARPSRGGVWLYAPTTLPTGGACIEVSQVYQRLAGEIATGKYFGLWDWCESGPNGKFAVFEPEDSLFHERYVRSYQGRDTYAVSIVTPNTGHTYGQCWYASIYDYDAGGWVGRLVSCGIPFHGDAVNGWTMWDSWYVADNGRCPTLPSIRALDVSLADPGTSSYVAFTNYPADHADLAPSGRCWARGKYRFDFPVPGLAANTWRADTPTP